jgi:hypothetical protein
MKHKHSFSAMAMLLALSGGSIFAARGTSSELRPYRPHSYGSGRQAKKPRSHKRKNPFRGTTYARHFEVARHVTSTPEGADSQG